LSEQQEAEERRIKDARERGLDNNSLQSLREAEAAAKSHDAAKSQHYAKLGSTFAIKAKPLQMRTKGP
jgi:hypothetical protein